MGKKMNMKKKNVRIDSNGFNDVSSEQRRQLTEYYDKLFSGKLTEEESKKGPLADEKPNDDDDFSDADFERELSLISHIRKSEPVEPAKTIELHQKPIFTEEPDDDEEDDEEDDLDVDDELSSEICGHDNDDEDDEDDDVDNGVDADEFDYILQNPLSYDQDYQQINIVSNMKNCASVDLFDMIDLFHDDHKTGDGAERYTKEMCDRAISLFRQYLISSTHPTVVLPMEVFEDKIIKQLGMITDNAIIFVIPYDEDFRRKAVGILLVDLDRFAQNWDALITTIKEENLVFHVLNKLLENMEDWRFESEDIYKYSSKAGDELNQLCINAVIRYFHLYGHPIDDAHRTMSGFLNMMQKDNRYIDLSANTRKAYEHGLNDLINKVLYAPQNIEADVDDDPDDKVDTQSSEESAFDHVIEYDDEDIQRDEDYVDESSDDDPEEVPEEPVAPSIPKQFGSTLGELMKQLNIPVEDSPQEPEDAEEEDVEEPVEYDESVEVEEVDEPENVFIPEEEPQEPEKPPVDEEFIFVPVRK